MNSQGDHDINPSRRGHYKQLPQGTAYDAESKPVSVEDFRYPNDPAGREAAELVEEREVFMLFGALWAEVMEWVYVPKNARLIGMRFKAVLYCCRPQMLGESTLEKIAQKEGVTKQTFQALTRSFRRRFKMVCRAMRTDESCENMRAAALRVHARKRRAATAGGH